MRRPGAWFQLLAAGGFLLGILLIVEAVLTYRYVTGQLVEDHMTRLAGQFVSALENRARQEQVANGEDLQNLLEEMAGDRPALIAWMQVLDQEGSVLASAGASETGVSATVLSDLLESRSQSVVELRTERGAEGVLAVALPFRFRLPVERVQPSAPRTAAGQPRFNIAQLGLFLHGDPDPFAPLRRNLLVSTAAALALLGSMAVFLVQLPRYLRGRELQQQLAVARRVQQELLPSGCPSCGEMDFAAQCRPAFEVGGDYYDIVPSDSGHITLVLGDVSGKGLPAALLMGLVHGVVRAYSGLWDGSNHAELTERLNHLLYTSTSQERFASMFWAHYDARKQALCYVNAGHLAPLVFRGASGVERLEKGGPVLGAFVSASYEPGEAALGEDDLLVVYSDGVVEAENTMQEEFGEERLIRIVERSLGRSAAEIQETILRELDRFTGSRAHADDVTTLVARFGPRRDAEAA